MLTLTNGTKKLMTGFVKTVLNGTFRNTHLNNLTQEGRKLLTQPSLLIQGTTVHQLFLHG